MIGGRMMRREEVGGVSVGDAECVMKIGGQDGHDFFAIGTGCEKMVGDCLRGAYNWSERST